MGFKVADRVKERIYTSGTGNVVLLGSGVTGFQSFQNALSNADYTYYVLEEDGIWETGYGQFINGEFSRDVVFDSSDSGSHVSLSGSGTAQLSITYPSERAVYLNQDNLYTIGGSGLVFNNAPTKALKTSSDNLYWDDNQLAYNADQTYISGVAAFASGQSIVNQNDLVYVSGLAVNSEESQDISYVSGIAVYASGAVGNKQYENISESTIVSQDQQILFVDTASDDINVYIPLASGNGGKELKIKKISGPNDVVVWASGSETIDGQNNLTIKSIYQSITLTSNNTNWFIT